jgi:uncharacterized membrane protein
MNKKEIIPIVILIAMFAAAIAFHSSMPDKMITHWGADGAPDGYGGKFTGLWLMPLVAVGIYLLLSIIPLIAVYKKNIMKFYSYYVWFKIVFVAFFSVLYAYTILQNLGYKFDFGVAMLPLLAALFLFIAVMISKAKRNFFIGIRTPWTLSSEKVWDKTHKVGAWAFGALAVFILIGLMFKEYLVWFILIPALAYVVFIFTYSYLLYQKYGESK